MPLHARLGRDIAELLERVDKLRPAVGIAAVVDAVDADPDLVCAARFGKRERERQEDRIARGDVGRRYRLADLFEGHVLFDGLRTIGQRASTEPRQVNGEDDVFFNGEAFRDVGRRVELPRVALTVVYGERVNIAPLRFCDGAHGRGIEAAGK